MNLSVWPDGVRLASLVGVVGVALRLTGRWLALMAFGALVVSLFVALIGGAFPAAAFGSPACTVHDSPMYTHGSASMQCRTHSEPGARRGPPLAAGAAVAGTPVSIHALGVAAKTESRVLSKVDDLPCNCFVAGTTVKTSTGAKPIEDVRPGDQVWAKNLTNGKNELRPVTGLFQKKSTTLMTITLASGATVVVTQEHPFMVEGEGWVLSGDLRVGDHLTQRDGGTATLAAIQVQPGGADVYNFEVAGDRNYYITDAQLLVHNCAMQARPGALANAWGYSTKQIKTAIERVKQQATWRGDGAHRNPDVLVDDVTGEVYPQVRGGTPAEDSIGNLFDHLPPGTR